MNPTAPTVHRQGYGCASLLAFGVVLGLGSRLLGFRVSEHPFLSLAVVVAAVAVTALVEALARSRKATP